MDHQKNDFFLRAFKPAENLTIAQRAERILLQQRFIADELKIWAWYLTDKTEIDIRDDACYDLIYKQAKKGLNAKLVKITRYQPNDIADAQSTCMFLTSPKFIPVPLIITHKLGYCGRYNESETIGFDHFINEESLNNETVLSSLVDRIITEYKPRELYLSTTKYFHDVAKTPDDIAWTGWITYLDNSINLPKLKPDFCQTEQKQTGMLFKTSANMFDDSNPEHVDTALRLEQWFTQNKVKV